MLTDAHCHPQQILIPGRSTLQILAAASACEPEEFARNEELAQIYAAEGPVKLLPCFAIHPQQFASHTEIKEKVPLDETDNCSLLTALYSFASEGRLAAIGEFGFDLYNAEFRETEADQDKVFAAHLEIARRFDLPVILHVRRAMDKIFAHAKNLAKCKAVIFHSWAGTYEEGQALLRQKVNAYFSFGNTILNGHKQAQRCCSLFPAERLLTETDSPYQPRRGKNFSHWNDLPAIIEAVSALRREAGSETTDAKELKSQIEKNFRNIFK